MTARKAFWSHITVAILTFLIMAGGKFSRDLSAKLPLIFENFEDYKIFLILGGVLISLAVLNYRLGWHSFIYSFGVAMIVGVLAANRHNAILYSFLMLYGLFLGYVYDRGYQFQYSLIRNMGKSEHKIALVTSAIFVMAFYLIFSGAFVFYSSLSGTADGRFMLPKIVLVTLIVMIVGRQILGKMKIIKGPNLKLTILGLLAVFPAYYLWIDVSNWQNRMTGEVAAWAVLVFPLGIVLAVVLILELVALVSGVAIIAFSIFPPRRWMSSH